MFSDREMQGSQLYSVFRCPGGGGGDGLYVRYNGDTYSATAADINGVKLLILEQLGIPVRSQRIMFEGMELGNGKLFESRGWTKCPYE